MYSKINPSAEDYRQMRLKQYQNDKVLKELKKELDKVSEMEGAAGYNSNKKVFFSYLKYATPPAARKMLIQMIEHHVDAFYQDILPFYTYNQDNKR
jgi:hypothetical protein